MSVTNLNHVYLEISFLAQANQLKTLLSNSDSTINIHYVNERGRNALIQCILGSEEDHDDDGDVSDRRVQCIKFLIKQGVKVEKKDNNGRTALHWAVAINKPKLVAELLEYGANPFAEDEGGITAVHLAVKCNANSCLDTIIEAAPEQIDNYNSAGYHPLAYAVQLGNLYATETLLKHGASVNRKCNCEAQRTSLHYAIYEEHLDVFNTLLRYGGRADIPDAYQKCVIHKAACVTDISYLEAILDNIDSHFSSNNNNMVQEGAGKKKGGGKGSKGRKKSQTSFDDDVPPRDEVVEVQNEEGATALMLACQREEVEHVRALLEKGGGINVIDYTGKTALHYCVENGNPVIAEMVINKNPDLLNKKDREGYSPLHLSVIANNKNMISCLLDNGASITQLDNEGHNTIHWATVCGHVELIDFLQGRGAKLNRPDSHNAFALHYAAQMCGARAGEDTDPKTGRKMLAKLLSKDVDVDCRDQDKRTPLIWAASSGSKVALESLIQAGGDVTAADKDGLTALHCAASRGHNNCMNLLLKQGAKVDSADKNGCTALFYAVTLGHSDCAKNLLKNGANPSQKDNRGRTPGHCAAAKGSQDSMKMLQSFGADLWLPNNKGERPIHEAALAKETDTVKYLMNKNKEKDVINTSNNENRTVLHIAAITNNLKLCKLLVSKGAKNNTTMKHKKFKDKKLSPYQAAVLKGSMETAEYLAPITDPPSDIDDEEWEARRQREREKELIRQRERELQEKLKKEMEEEESEEESSTDESTGEEDTPDEEEEAKPKSAEKTAEVKPVQETDQPNVAQQSHKETSEQKVDEVSEKVDEKPEQEPKTPLEEPEEQNEALKDARESPNNTMESSETQELLEEQQKASEDNKEPKEHFEQPTESSVEQEKSFEVTESTEEHAERGDKPVVAVVSIPLENKEEPEEKKPTKTEERAQKKTEESKKKKVPTATLR